MVDQYRAALAEKNVLAILPLFDIVTHFLPEGVIVIAYIADRQQVAVLGIEDEEETVEKNQGGFAHFRQRRRGRGGCDGAGKPRKNLAEDQTGKARGDTLFVEPAFLDSTLVERARIGRPGKESFVPEDEHEHLKPMVSLRFGEGEQAVIVAGEIEKHREVDFEKLLRDGPRTLIIESPPCAVGKDAPAQLVR